VAQLLQLREQQTVAAVEGVLVVAQLDTQVAQAVQA